MPPLMRLVVALGAVQGKVGLHGLSNDNLSEVDGAADKDENATCDKTMMMTKLLMMTIIVMMIVMMMMMITAYDSKL